MTIRKTYRGYVQKRQLRWWCDREDDSLRMLIFNMFPDGRKHKEVEVEIRILGPAETAPNPSNVR
jgi:hypothetical protein